MTSTFQLALDTRAPTVTFEGAGGTTAGELLAVLYSIDEPAITSASIRLADGRDLALEILSDRLRVLLPPDTPDGNATVTVHTADDVGNTRTQTTVVVLHGSIVVPPEEPPVTIEGGPPQRSRPTPPLPFRRRRDHAVVEITTRSRIRARVHENAEIRILDAGVRVTRPPVTSASELTVTSSARTHVRQRSGSRIRVTETTAIERYWPPPGDDDLIALGLL